MAKYAYNRNQLAIENFFDFCKENNFLLRNQPQFANALDAFLKDASTAANRPPTDIIQWEEVQALAEVDDDLRWSFEGNDE